MCYDAVDLFCATADNAINDEINGPSAKYTQEEDERKLKGADAVALQQGIDQLEVHYLAAKPGASGYYLQLSGGFVHVRRIVSRNGPFTLSWGVSECTFRGNSCR